MLNTDFMYYLTNRYGSTWGNSYSAILKSSRYNSDHYNPNQNPVSPKVKRAKKKARKLAKAKRKLNR